MKKIIAVLTFLFCSFSFFAQAVITTPLGGSAFCQNEDLNLSFVITGVFTPRNTFSAQLST
jgi:hypothetical protein